MFENSICIHGSLQSSQDIQLLADEIAASSRAGLALGIPRDRSRQQLAETCSVLSSALDAGLPISQAVAQVKGPVDRSLVAFLAAGMQSGRISESLELFAGIRQQWQQVRRDVALAVVYPLTVLSISAVLFALYVSQFLSLVFEQISGSATDAFRQLVIWNELYWWWPILLPLALMCLFFFWWVSSNRFHMTALQQVVMYTIPGLPGLIRSVHDFQVSRLLELLIERAVPLPDALDTAAQCCDRAAYRLGAQQLAEVIRKGQSLSDIKSPLPPLLKVCCLENAFDEKSLRLRLQGVSGFYERRMAQQTSWLQSTLPIGMLLIFGGGSVVLYSLSVFLPIVRLYEGSAN